MELTLINLLTRFMFGAAYTTGGVLVVISVVWFIARLAGISFLPPRGVETTTGIINDKPGGYPWARIFKGRGRKHQQEETTGE
jgi:hypothetical protein